MSRKRPRRRKERFRRKRTPRPVILPAPATYSFPADAWWLDAFQLQPTASEIGGHRCGSRQMLTLIGYDITDPKRLRKVAQVCEDWGVRVQYSMFECRLDATAFEGLWKSLKAVIDDKEDRVVAYKICLNCAREVRCAGLMTTTEKVVSYIC